LPEFLALFTQLRKAQFNLEQAAGGLEAQFLATGKDCDSSVFAGAIRRVEHSTRFLVECREQTGKMLELLRNRNAQIEHLLGAESHNVL
jgi:hypothetical protein